MVKDKRSSEGAFLREHGPSLHGGDTKLHTLKMLKIKEELANGKLYLRFRDLFPTLVFFPDDIPRLWSRAQNKPKLKSRVLKVVNGLTLTRDERCSLVSEIRRMQESSRR